MRRGLRRRFLIRQGIIVRSTPPLPARSGRPDVIVRPAVAPDASSPRSSAVPPAPDVPDPPLPVSVNTPAAQRWEDLPPEIRGMIVADLRGRDLSRFARSAHSSSQASAASLLHREPLERNAQLAQLVEYGAAPTLATLLHSPNDTQFDWRQRDVTGATLLMQALRAGSGAVVEALVAGPACLFAGMDVSGWNILHHAVSRGQTRFLQAMLDRHPVLAAYADFSGNQAGTPLHMAYMQRDDAMFDLLLATPVARIDALIAHAGDPTRPTACATSSPSPTSPPFLPTLPWEPFPASTPPPDGPYPFDPTGQPVSLAARRAMSNSVGHRQPTATRLELLKAAIDDHEPAFARRVLHRLDPEVLANARENILHAVTEQGQFATARIVIEHFGERAFAPLSNGATLCHLAASRMEDDLLNWVLRKPAASALLGVLDDDGRTPLHCAAAAGSVRCFVALHGHYPDLSLRDAYRRGALQLLFRADPAAAHQVLANPALQARLTPADLTATLQAAFRKLLDFDFESSWRLNGGDTLEVNTDLAKMLLSLPPGRIDVRAQIGESGHSVLTLLQSGTLARLLERGSSDEQDEASEAVRGCYSQYGNHALLARALVHGGASALLPAAPPDPAAALLQPYIAPGAAR